jgi:hypothetical protein
LRHDDKRNQDPEEEQSKSRPAGGEGRK